MWKRAILHCDINHCFAQIEEMKNPVLKTVPMAVGGNEEKRHGIILARNLLAKPFNIKTAEPVRDAIKKCPNLVCISPSTNDYVYYTEQVKDIYREYTDKVESFGLDEAWIDVTECQSLFGDPVDIAREIQNRVYNEIGLTISIGVSYNKVFAKLGSDMVKPSGLTVITEENLEQTVYPLPVEDLLYVGPATKEKLNKIDIFTIGDLAARTADYMRKVLGKQGELIHCFARGLDITEVNMSTFKRAAKSVGNGVTAVHNIDTFEDAKMVFYVLAESVASRLKDNGQKGNVISISLRDTDLKWVSHQRKLEEHTNTSKEIMQTVVSLLKESWTSNTSLRSINVTVSSLVPEGSGCQVNLFVDPEQRMKDRKIDLAMDYIRGRFGFDAIKRCVLLQDSPLTDFNPKGDHTIHPVGFYH